MTSTTIHQSAATLPLNPSSTSPHIASSPRPQRRRVGSCRRTAAYPAPLTRVTDLGIPEALRNCRPDGTASEAFINLWLPQIEECLAAGDEMPFFALIDLLAKDWLTAARMAERES